MITPKWRSRAVGAVGAVAAALMCGLALAGDAMTISGAGATFPYPAYAKWADTYAKETGVKLNYQAIGSGGGIKQITESTVDFGASDAPFKPEELDKADLMQFPVVMGAVVPVINLDGIKAGQLKLTPRPPGGHVPREDQEVGRPKTRRGQCRA